MGGRRCRVAPLLVSLLLCASACVGSADASGDTGPARTLASTPLRISEVMLACASGDPAVQCVELIATDPIPLPSLRLTLRTFDRNGELMWELQSIFQPRRPTPIDRDRTWLLATPEFTAATGLTADVRVGPGPPLLDPGAGRVELVLLALGELPEEIIDSIDYGPGSVRPPEPGTSIQLATTAYMTDQRPTPKNFDRAAPTQTACFATLAEQRFHVAELFLRCFDGSADAQFIELQPSAAGARFGTHHSLVFLDRLGAVLSRIDDCFADRAGEDWPLGRTWLLAGPGFQARAGFPPDVLLPTTLDTLGGAIRLVERDDAQAVERVFSELVYGGVAPRPTPGSSLRRTASGSYVVESGPIASAFDPLSFGGLEGCTNCPANLANLTGLGGGYTLTPALSLVNSYGRAEFDLVSGTARAEANLGTTTVVVEDRYLLRSPSSTSSTVRLRVQVDVTKFASCTEHGHCGYADAGIHIVMGSVVDTSFNQGHFPAEFDLPLDPGQVLPVRLEMTAVCDPISGADAYADVRARLSFPSLPTGTSIQSCWGFRQDAPVPALMSLVAAYSDDAGVHLIWNSSQVRSARLERREGEIGWTVIAQPLSDGRGDIRWDDHDVEGGRTYAYRLAWGEGGLEMYSDEVLVETSGGAVAFGLRLLGPNPGAADPTVELATPNHGGVTFQILDVAGRIVHSQDAGYRRPGRHVVTLSPTALPAGTYWVRARQAGSEVVRAFLRIR